MPVLVVQTTGVPTDSASRIVMPNGSSKLGST